MNLGSDSFFRNRDVCQIFRRLGKMGAGDKFENKMGYETFLGFVTK